MWRSRMRRPCSHKGLSNQRTTWSSKRRSEEWRSGDSHLEWPPRIMGFIHARNVCQKEVITFSRLQEEEEARLIRREEKMGATEDQALTVHTRRIHRKKEDHHHNKRQKEFIRDPFNIWCYTCDEKGHYSRDCPRNGGPLTRSQIRRDIMLTPLKMMNQQ